MHLSVHLSLVDRQLLQSQGATMEQRHNDSYSAHRWHVSGARRRPYFSCVGSCRCYPASVTTEADQRWTKQVASGIGWIFLALVASIVLANAAGFWVGMSYQSRTHEEAIAKSQAMSWVAAVGLPFTLPLLVGVWKSSGPGLPSSIPSWARSLFRAVAVFSSAARVATVLCRFMLPEHFALLSWTSVVLWYLFCLFGLQYLRWVLLTLGHERLALQARLFALSYALLVALDFGLNQLFLEEQIQYPLSVFATTTLLDIIFLVLIARLALKSRQALLH